MCVCSQVCGALTLRVHNHNKAERLLHAQSDGVELSRNEERTAKRVAKLLLAHAKLAKDQLAHACADVGLSDAWVATLMRKDKANRMELLLPTACRLQEEVLQPPNGWTALIGWLVAIFLTPVLCILGRWRRQ